MEARQVLQQTERYLTEVLLPFWIERSPDRQYGGFLTYFDRDGRPTGQTAKTFLMQVRMLYAMSAAHRAGYGAGRCGELADRAADFILDHYWDADHGGWYWIADRAGTPTSTAKVGYGQCFGIYAFSEYEMAIGDGRGREAAQRTYAAVSAHMADTRHGGYYEIMRRDWQPARPGRGGGDRKSFDVHMHMMEALTNLYAMTGAATHRRRLHEAIDLILGRMLHPAHGAGYQQFALDFTPLGAIDFDVEWGSDEPAAGGAKPVDATSYGHNAEFAWLLLRAADVLGEPPARYAEIVRRICDHCAAHGIDPEHGGVYIEGPMDGEATNRHKQFWQQAEVMVAMLDACALLGDRRYWEAFANVHRCVFERFVNLAGGGEWFALLDRAGTPIWDYMGHEWKINYHTVRSMIEVVRRLRVLTNRHDAG